MSRSPSSSGTYCAKTTVAFLASSILSAPLLAAYNFFGVILYRDLHGTALQVTLLTMLKPLVALFSLYWSHRISERSDRLLPNLVWSGLLARLPFLFFPFVTNSWTLIGCAAFYMMLSRGGIPAWMEILRKNLSREHQSRVFSDSSSISYVEGMILAVSMGLIMDSHASSWRWICPLSALMGIISIFFQLRIPLKVSPVPTTVSSLPLWREIVDPWRNAFQLMRSQGDFRRFQWGYVLSGAGMMVLQPALPIFFVDVLGVTYTELAIALSLCKGLGFALSSRLWARWFKTANLFSFSCAIFVIVAFFPLLLLLAPQHLVWLYGGYFIYGVGQAGSEMCWHLSGPAFARHEDSSLYSGVNVTMVGIRGAIAPPLGSVLCLFFGPLWVFVASGFLCGCGGYFMWRRVRDGERYCVAPAAL